MKLTILGKSPSWQDAGGACSGYLLQTETTSVLVDCGNGVFGKLREHLDYVDLDAVVISHMHADHWLDLIPYSYALIYSPRQQPVPVHIWEGTDSPARPRLVAPPGGLEAFRQVAGAWDQPDLIETAFAVEEHEEGGGEVTIGDIHASFHSVPHFIDTYAINVHADGGGRLTYGADCRPGPELIEIARDSDLLLVEATLPRPERDGIRGHMTPAEAAEHARLAGVKRVVLTHISDELGDEWALDDAKQAFDGPMDIAAESAVYEI